jgi:hypothetical protein
MTKTFGVIIRNLAVILTVLNFGHWYLFEFYILVLEIFNIRPWILNRQRKNQDIDRGH